jgi:hypothetical protein
LRQHFRIKFGQTFVLHAIRVQIQCVFEIVARSEDLSEEPAGDWVTGKRLNLGKRKVKRRTKPDGLHGEMAFVRRFIPTNLLRKLPAWNCCTGTNEDVAESEHGGVIEEKRTGPDQF